MSRLTALPPLLLVAGVLATVPARAQQADPATVPQEAAAETLPLWERTLYKTLTYQAAANLSDLALYDLVLGGTALAGAGFFAANATSAAALYYGFEYAWQTFGPPPEETTHQTVFNKTVLYRIVNSTRNFAIGYSFGGTVGGAASFVVGNILTDTPIYVANEYAWDVFRPRAPTVPAAR